MTPILSWILLQLIIEFWQLKFALQPVWCISILILEQRQSNYVKTLLGKSHYMT